MKHLSTFAALLVWALAATVCAQDNRVFDWTPANSETIPLEPASLHAGRVYHPAAGGGNMHVGIESRYPLTIAMAWADAWNAAMQHPDAPVNFDFLCVKEHVTSTTYECHLPSERPMIITFRDERRPEKPAVSTIRAILGPGAQQFISPNDLHIQYYSWNCVDNCILPEFHWRSEEHTSELQSRRDLVCRLLLEKKKISLSPGNPERLRRVGYAAAFGQYSS